MEGGGGQDLLCRLLWETSPAICWFSTASGFRDKRNAAKQKSREFFSISRANLKTKIMGTYLKKYDKDYMKMAVLKQEETFRQQVHELHRLYRVQKLLMNDMKAEIKSQRKSSNTKARHDRWNAENETDMHHQNRRRAQQVLNLELPAEEYIEEESDLELTLATGGSRRRKNDNSFTSDSGASFSSSSTESGGVKLNGNDWGLFQVPDINIGRYRSERKSKFNAEEQMISEERVKQPPWLFHCLNLNMT